MSLITVRNKEELLFLDMKYFVVFTVCWRVFGERSLEEDCSKTRELMELSSRLSIWIGKGLI